jgi:hypothetical protein
MLNAALTNVARNTAGSGSKTRTRPPRHTTVESKNSIAAETLGFLRQVGVKGSAANPTAPATPQATARSKNMSWTPRNEERRAAKTNAGTTMRRKPANPG